MNDEDEYSNLALTQEGISNCCKSMLAALSEHSYFIVICVFLGFFVSYAVVFALGIVLINLNLKLDGAISLQDITGFWNDPCYTTPFAASLFGLFGWCLCGSFLLMTSVLWDTKLKNRDSEEAQQRKRRNGVDLSRRYSSSMDSHMPSSIGGSSSQLEIENMETVERKDCFTRSVHNCFKPMMPTKYYEKVEVLDFGHVCIRNRSCVLIWSEGISSCCMLPWLVMLVVASWAVLGNSHITFTGVVTPCSGNIPANATETAMRYKDTLDTTITLTFFLVFFSWLIFGVGAVAGVVRAVIRKLRSKDH